MKRMIIIGTVFLLGSIFMIGCAGSQAAADSSTTTVVEAKHHCEHCAKQKMDNITTYWCPACKKGYVEGKETKCEGCVHEAKTGTHEGYDHWNYDHIE